MMVANSDVTDWLERYFLAWQTADGPACARLFTPDGLYVVSPYEQPWPDGERMRGRTQIAEFAHWLTVEHLRFLNGGYELWAIDGSKAYVRWWADLEFRGQGYWTNGEGVLKLTFADRDNGHLLCSELLEWNPAEPEAARHYERYPGNTPESP